MLWIGSYSIKRLLLEQSRSSRVCALEGCSEPGKNELPSLGDLQLKLFLHFLFLWLQFFQVISPDLLLNYRPLLLKYGFFIRLNLSLDLDVVFIELSSFLLKTFLLNLRRLLALSHSLLYSTLSRGTRLVRSSSSVFHYFLNVAIRSRVWLHTSTWLSGANFGFIGCSILPLDSLLSFFLDFTMSFFLH